MKKILLLFVLAVAITNVFGTSYTWNGGSSTWNTPGNWTPNGTPGTGDDVTINSATPITITLGSATLANTLSVSGGSTISFAGGTFGFTINSGLTFAGGTKISLTTQGAFTLGNGTATFSLSGNDASNYFTATSGNGYLAVNNNSSGSINLFVDPAITWYNFVIQKGTTVLKSNCLTNRLGLSSLNSQILVLDNNVAFTLNGTGSSSLGANGSSTAGYVDASAPGSKFTFMGNGNAGASVFAGTNRIFANGATVNHLEMNTTSVVLTPNTALKVNTLTLTAGNINNSTNNITVLNGGTIIRANQNALLAAAPIFGLASTDKVNIQYNTTCTTGNELFGTVGTIGTVTVNNGVTATLSNSSVTSIALSGVSVNNFTAPTISIAAPTNGVTATATCLTTGSGSAKTLLSVLITNPGYGYTSAPTVTITDATGTATGTTSVNSQTGTTTINALNIGGGATGTVTYPNTNSKVMTLNVKDLTVNTGATFTCGTQTNNITHLLNVEGNITNNGTFTTITSAGTKVVDVTMNGTTAQAINSAVTFNGLTISNTISPVSVGATLNTTSLTINSGAILDMQSNALNSVTTISGTGKLKTQATATAIPTGKTWSFNVDYNNANGGQSVIAGTYTGGLTMSNTSGINTAASSLTIGGVLTLNSDSKLLLPSGYSIISGTGFTGSTGAGTLQIGDQNNVSYKIPTGLTWSGTVEYVFAGNNRIVPGYYNNLIVDDGTPRTINWGNADGETGTIGIAGTLTISSTSYDVNQVTIEFNGTNQTIPRINTYNLKLSGSGTTFPATYLYIANNFDPGSIASANQGTIVFNGTASQTIPAFGYYSLNVSNTLGATLNSNLSVPTLSINASGIMNIAAGKQLTVSTSMTNNGTLNLLSTSGDGTATILTPASIGGTGGAAIVEQYLASSRNWYMSSPVTGATASAGPSYYKYVEALNDGFTWTTVNSGDGFDVMTGYIVKPTTATTYSFAGTLNTGNKTISGLTSNATAKIGFNLVGNPYPSYVKWSEAVKTNLDQTMWYRTHDGSSYKFYTYHPIDGAGGIGVPSTVTDYIPPMQAFWVKVNTGQTGSLQFLNTSRDHKDGAGSVFRAPKAPNTTMKLLRLQVSNATENDETVLYFNANASDNLDSYDSQKMFNNNTAIPEIYTTAGAEKLVINGMTDVKYDTEIPLGFVSGQTNSFSIKATELKNFEVGTRIILRDKVDVADYELTESNKYTFTSDAVNTSNRFSILFKTSSATTDNLDVKNRDTYAFVNSNNKIVISAPENSTFNVYNAMGQLIETGQIRTKLQTLNTKLSAGVYVVNLENKSSKVIIK